MKAHIKALHAYVAVHFMQNRVVAIRVISKAIMIAIIKSIEANLKFPWVSFLLTEAEKIMSTNHSE